MGAMLFSLTQLGRWTIKKGEKFMKGVMMMLCAGVVLLSAFVLTAGQPPGLEKKGKVPPGFSKGKKTGWKNEYPPGWDQKSEKEKKDWEDQIQKGQWNWS